MDIKPFIKYILIIIVILAIVFLSQQVYTFEVGKKVSSNISDKATAYMAKGSDWITSKMYPKVTGEVQKRGDIIKNEVKTEKEKVSENIGEKISNYFSGVSNSIIHPGTPQNCLPAQTGSTAK